MPSTPYSMSEIVQRAIRKEIEDIIVEEGDAAAKRVQEKVRASVGSIASRVLDYYTFEKNGQ